MNPAAPPKPNSACGKQGPARPPQLARRQRIHATRALARFARLPPYLLLAAPSRSNGRRLYRFSFNVCFPAHTAPPRPMARLKGAAAMRMARALTRACARALEQRHMTSHSQPHTYTGLAVPTGRSRRQRQRDRHKAATAARTRHNPPQPGQPGQQQVGGGGRPVEVDTLPRAEASPQDLGIYCELQHSGWCGAHALNALLGGQVTTGADMLQYLTANWPRGRRNGDYNDNGWFSIDALNFWLHEHTPVGMKVGLYSITLDMTTTSSRDTTGTELRDFLESKQCFSALVNVGRQHWVAVMRGPKGHAWWIVDSIHYSATGRVRPMTERDWGVALQRQWAFNALAPMDAAFYGVNTDIRPPLHWMAVPTEAVVAGIRETRMHPHLRRRCEPAVAEHLLALRTARRAAVAAPRPGVPRFNLVSDDPDDEVPQVTMQQAAPQALRSPPRGEHADSTSHGSNKRPLSKDAEVPHPDSKESGRALKRVARVPPAAAPLKAPPARRLPSAARASGIVGRLTARARAATQSIEKFFSARKHTEAPPEHTATQAQPPPVQPQPRPPPDAPLVAPPLPPPHTRAQRPPPSAPAPRSQSGTGTAETPQPAPLTMLTLNVRGIRPMGTHLEALLHDNQPDLIALTETLHTGQQKRLPGSVKRALRGYHLVHTPAAPSTTGGDRPTGGIMLGVRNETFTRAGLTFSQGLPIGDVLQGRHARLTITGQGRTLNIQAVYLPAGDRPEDAATREALYGRIGQCIQEGAGADIVLGDMNAALLPSDRSHPLYARDRRHRHFADALGLRPFEVAGTGGRDRTYRTAEGLVSRIDDILTTCPEAQLQEWRQSTTVATDTMEGNDTDHDALIVRVPWGALGLEPPCHLGPQCAVTTPRKLKTPMSTIDRESLKRALEQHQGPRWAALGEELARAATDLAEHHRLKEVRRPGQPLKLESMDCGAGRRPAADCIEDWGAQISSLLTDAQALAMKVCATTPSNGGRHYQPRGVARAWRQLKQWRKEVAHCKCTPFTNQMSSGLHNRLEKLRGSAAEHGAPPTPTELATLATTLDGWIVTGASTWPAARPLMEPSRLMGRSGGRDQDAAMTCEGADRGLESSVGQIRVPVGPRPFGSTVGKARRAARTPAKQSV